MPDQQPTGIGCPTCWNNGQGIRAMLFATPGKFSYFCLTGHEFNDMGELLALDPPRLQVPQKKAQQVGHVKVEFMIPPDLNQTLLQKFGNADRLAQTLAGVLRVLAEGRAIMINEVDVERIEKLVGQKFTTGGELVGIVYERQQKINELNAKLAGQIQNAPEGTRLVGGDDNGSSGVKVPAGKVLLDATLFLGKARSVASFRSQSVERVCEDTLKTAFDNGWA